MTILKKANTVTTSKVSKELVSQMMLQHQKKLATLQIFNI